MKGRKLTLALIFMLGLVLTGSLCYRAGRVEGASGGGVPGSAGDPYFISFFCNFPGYKPSHSRPPLSRIRLQAQDTDCSAR